MLRNEVPSANSLFTFEAVARWGSFTDAARELNVTQPAVSRSINALEAHLGYMLFKRHGRWIELTPNGDKLFRATSAAFSTVTESLRYNDQQQQSGETVLISMSPSIVCFWFLPRMAAFRAKFPSISLEFMAYSRDIDAQLHDVDLGIRLSNPTDADMHRWPFSDEKILALCAPEYLEKNGSLDKPVAGRPHTLIEQTNQRYTMDEFFHAVGRNILDKPSFLKFSDYTTIIQAAIQGQGIALAWVTEASRQIIDGNLVPACTQVVKTGRRYHVVASNLKPMRQVAEDVRDWLISEMRTDQIQLAAILKARWNLF